MGSKEQLGNRLYEHMQNKNLYNWKILNARYKASHKRATKFLKAEAANRLIEWLRFFFQRNVYGGDGL